VKVCVDHDSVTRSGATETLCSLNTTSPISPGGTQTQASCCPQSEATSLWKRVLLILRNDDDNVLLLPILAPLPVVAYPGTTSCVCGPSGA